MKARAENAGVIRLTWASILFFIKKRPVTALKSRFKRMIASVPFSHYLSVSKMQQKRFGQGRQVGFSHNARCRGAMEDVVLLWTSGRWLQLYVRDLIDSVRNERMNTLATISDFLSC